MSYKKEVEELVNVDIYKIKEESTPVNGGNAIFSKKDYEMEAGAYKYLKIDKLGRSTGAIAMLNKNTRPRVRTEDLKYLDPDNWVETLNKKEIYERCHIIAYSLLARDTDKRNIFIGTERINTSIMRKFENEVDKYIGDHDNNVLYRVTVKYKDDNIIPTGVLIEAKSIDDDELNICEFCYNVQTDVKINYKNGDIIEDNRIAEENEEQKSKTDKHVKKSESKDKKINAESLQNYILDIKNDVFHLDKECVKLKNIESEFIQETRARRSAVENADLKPCKKCVDA